MKKVLKLAGIVGLFILGLSACQQIPNVTPTSGIANRVQQGTWKVTMYNDSGKAETYKFTGYEITFNSNGAIAAVKGSSSISGTWTLGTDDSEQKLILNFGEVIPFDELSDDWSILEESETKIRLQDVSKGNGGTDLLTIERI